MSDTLIGKTLAGRFVLEELLGTGAAGAVYRAQQTSVDRIVAVKTLHSALQGREDFKDRFEIEAKAIARLNHPNCITLYDFGYDADYDVFYMALEYSRGRVLSELMESPLAYDEVLSIAYQVADALDHAHGEGILHRDLKPENIMIERSPNSGRSLVKVLDFGLARLYEERAEQSNEPPSGRYKQITQMGQVYGTPAYMSPEQCRSTTELSPATDIYSLGTMMYELLEGKLPFYSKSTAELILMQMTQEPPRMEREDVPLVVRDLVHQMMAKDPAVRPQSAQEVLAVLTPFVRLDASQEFRMLPGTSGELSRAAAERIDRAVRQASGAAAAVMEEAVLSRDELRAARSNRVPVALGGLAALALLVGILWVATRTEGGAPAHAETSSPAVSVPAEAAAPTSAPDADPLVEVATNGEEAGASNEGSSKPKAPRTTTPGKPQADSPPPRETNRPKTLKLEY